MKQEFNMTCPTCKRPILTAEKEWSVGIIRYTMVCPGCHRQWHLSGLIDQGTVCVHGKETSEL